MQPLLALLGVCPLTAWVFSCMVHCPTVHPLVPGLDAHVSEQGWGCWFCCRNCDWVFGVKSVLLAIGELCACLHWSSVLCTFSGGGRQNLEVCCGIINYFSIKLVETGTRNATGELVMKSTTGDDYSKERVAFPVYPSSTCTY